MRLTYRLNSAASDANQMLISGEDEGGRSGDPVPAPFRSVELLVGYAVWVTQAARESSMEALCSESSTMVSPRLRRCSMSRLRVRRPFRTGLRGWDRDSAAGCGDGSRGGATGRWRRGGNTFDYLHACGAALVNKLGYGERLPREHIPMKTRERKRHVVRCVFPDPRPRR